MEKLKIKIAKNVKFLPLAYDKKIFFLTFNNNFQNMIQAILLILLIKQANPAY